MKKKSSKAVRYNKWGYIFLIPFILVYVVFQLIPLFNTIYNSFFENYLSGLTQIGPNFVGTGELQNAVYTGRYLDLRKEYHDFMDHVFCATDYFVITVRCMVF